VRTVWCVGSNVGWPPEVYVIFGARREAERHAALSSYEFDVFALPVYERYEDCPVGLRLEASPSPSPSITTMAEDEPAFAALVASSTEATPESVPPNPVFGVGTWERQGEPEVWVLYASQAEAERHAELAYYAVETRELRVFASYAECPRTERYLSGGAALSQRVNRIDHQR
jgi:hypothetical protein